MPVFALEPVGPVPLHHLRALEVAQVTDQTIEAIADAVAARLAGQQVRPLYTPRTLASRLGVHERTARQYMLDGKVRSFKLGEGDKAPIRATPEAVDEYIARQLERSG